MKNLKALVADAAPAPAAASTRNDNPRRDRPDRAGQRLIAAHFDGDTFKNFKILCAEQGATTQAMVSEAIQLLCRQYHKPITDQLASQAAQRD
jgi:hypothetical protein